jgi:heat shock protein HtpX
MAGATDFRALEARNRRETIVLVAVFVAIFAVLGAGLDFISGDIRVINGQFYGFPLLTLCALLYAGVHSLVSFYGGAPLILASVHASALTADTPKHQMVLDVIQEMALAARMPVPKAYVMADPSPNAFATGRDPSHSVICVTQGLVDGMDREELQGVIGHEISHIRDYDIRTMMLVAVLVGGIAMLSDFFFRVNFYGGFPRSRQRGNESSNGGAIVVLAVVLLSILAPIIAQILAMAVSRQREYLADASSVEFTRNPRALLRALEHLARAEMPALQTKTHGTAHLFIADPNGKDRPKWYDTVLAAQTPERDLPDEGWWANLMSTHPPLGRRIARLRAIAGASQSSAQA